MKIRLCDNDHGQSSLSGSYAFILIIGFFLIAGLFFSCQVGVNNNSNAFLDSILTNVLNRTDKNAYLSDKEVRLLDSQFALASNPPPYYRAKIHYIKRYYYYLAQKDLPKAILHLDSCNNILQNHLTDKRSKDLYTASVFDAGNFSFQLKNYDAALHYFIIGKTFLLSNGADSCDLFLYYHSMANMLYAQQKYLQAAVFFKAKYNWARCGTIPGHEYAAYHIAQENLDNTGMCYQNAGLTDSAIYYFNSTLDYINQNQKKFPSHYQEDFNGERSVVYRNLATISFQQQNMEAAEILLTRSLNNVQSLDSDFIFSAKLLLVDIYLHRNKLKEAFDVLNNITATLNLTQTNTITGYLYKLFSSYYLKTGQPAKANAALLKAYGIRDSIDVRDRQFNATDVGNEFEIQEKTIRNESLKKDNAIKNNYLIAAIAGGTLAFLIAFSFWQNLSDQSRYANKLSLLTIEAGKQNIELEKALASLEQSHEENNRVVQVVAHDLKNPVSAIRTLAYSLRKKQNDAGKEMFSVIETACSDVIKLINDLLGNRKNPVIISKELVNMGTLIEQCTESFRVRALEKKQQLKLQTEHHVVLLNRQKMLEAISNIISNMIAFSAENEVLNIQLTKLEENVLLKLHSSMPANKSVAGFTNNTNDDDRTIELAISKQIIEDHNGRFWVEQQGNGARNFYVELPLA